MVSVRATVGVKVVVKVNVNAPGGCVHRGFRLFLDLGMPPRSDPAVCRLSKASLVANGVTVARRSANVASVLSVLTPRKSVTCRSILQTSGPSGSSN